MATISARIDDQLKARAEQIADSIGIPLSSAVNIFLRRFVVERGFPFSVKALDRDAANPSFPVYDPGDLEAAVKRAIANPDGPTSPDHFTYFDSESQQLETVYNRKGP